MVRIEGIDVHVVHPTPVAIEIVVVARTVEVTETDEEPCRLCEETDDDWVRLRLCLTCGQVSCCDDSVNKHATAHFAETGHPLIRSLDPVTPIVGPSHAIYNHDWMVTFLTNARDTGTLPDVEPSMGGEDFAYFANQVPGFFFRLGVVKPGTASGGLHTPTFRADDSAVPAGMRVMARLLVDYLTLSNQTSPR
mgnify:CR=1 FL=1